MNKKLFKYIIIISTCLYLLSYIPLFAQTSLKSNLDKIISNNELNKTTLISVSIRDAKTGSLVYDRYGDYLLHTASTLKAFTAPVILEYLGSNYKVSTKIYQSNKNKDLLIKLAGDPFLTTENLINTYKDLKEKGLNQIDGNILIDSSLIDNLPWGVGWMWDDENNPLMPKYNAFNLDNNVINIKATPGKYNQKPTINITPYYPVKIVNSAITTSKNKLKIERKPWLDPETIYISGTINTTIQKTIPIGNMQNYFISRLKYALSNNNINFSGKIKTSTYTSDYKLLAEINHDIIDLLAFTVQKSNNLSAETLFKIASAKQSKQQGTTNNGLNALKVFYTNIGAPIEKQDIVDASGASHNNLVQTNWMTLALYKLYNYSKSTIFLSLLAQPGQNGTLKNRLLPLSNKLRAKTGTLAGISGVTGYLKANSGKTYAFAILIQNYKGSSIKAKSIENQIIQTLNNY